MSNAKGFTLMEIITALMIVGIIATIAVPSYTIMIQQGAAKAAQNNLISIYNAEKNYYLNTGTYCTTSSATNAANCGSYTNCGENLSAINCNLSLNITDNNFGYQCIKGGVLADYFRCIATSNTDATFYFWMRNIALVAPNGKGYDTTTGAWETCTPNATGNPYPCNPYCHVGATPNLCPNQ